MRHATEAKAAVAIGIDGRRARQMRNVSARPPSVIYALIPIRRGQ